jgi:hypothetical protein
MGVLSVSEEAIQLLSASRSTARDLGPRTSIDRGRGARVRGGGNRNSDGAGTTARARFPPEGCVLGKRVPTSQWSEPAHWFKTMPKTSAWRAANR